MCGVINFPGLGDMIDGESSIVNTFGIDMPPEMTISASYTDI